jgi:hypothetical protein
LCLTGHSDFDADAVPLPRRLRWESPRYTILKNKIKSKIDSISTLFLFFLFLFPKFHHLVEWRGENRDRQALASWRRAGGRCPLLPRWATT